MTRETKNVLVLPAIIADSFVVALWLAGGTFTCGVCDVLMTRVQ